ncbi:MAG: excinuclease ABC subunit A, partial [Betaproteobacteria bacterium]|nr:excinuclease ABC subunit A [Betaproteobacteria bacterium]
MESSNRPPIRIRGARQNNLKNLDLDIPTGELVVVTGVSGSGKSSLVFDTLYAEGQRRYVETFSAYARQFLDRMDRPQVDRIEGVPPAIAIDQTNPVRTSRSTVGTMTEINDHVKLLWARFAEPHCPQGHGPVRASSAAEVCKELLIKASEAGDPRLILCFPVPIPQAFSQQEVEAMLLSEGYTRTEGQPYEARGRRFIDVVQDRFRASQVDQGRLREAVEACLSKPEGRLIVHCTPQHDANWRWSGKQQCALCDHRFAPVTPSHFSFNSPIGACESCRGFGRVIGIDWGLVIPDASKSLAQGAVKPWQTESFKDCQADLMRFAALQAIDAYRPWRDLSPAAKHWVLEGDPHWRGDWKRQWYGAKRFFEWLETKAYKMHVRVLLSRYRAYSPCSACSGTRLKPEAAHWRVANKGLHDLMVEPIAQVRDWFFGLQGQLPRDEAAELLTSEIRTRLSFLCEVGLGYLSLDRQSRSLSGGEVQRINLTTALGTSLVNTLFVLDEPSIGLHPRDMNRIIAVMQRLRDAGNSLVVVEHDPAVMWAADRLLDIGPGPGERGGEILFWGQPAELAQARGLTADYLLGRRDLAQTRTTPQKLAQKITEKTPKLLIEGARENNLKNVSVSIPLRALVCLTGVSGSGKSTLMQGILLPALLKAKGKPTEAPGDHDRVLGEDWLDDVVHVDQSPIGKTARSNPVSYVGAFDGVRKRFAALSLSRERSYTAGTFSFNSGNGRCPACSGSGFEHIEMQFLSDVYLRCSDCDGRRFRAEVLEVKERGRSVADVLDMTVGEALHFYARDPEIRSRLQPLVDVGLEYLRLGQPVPSLSGGEAQRLKLAGFLAQAAADARSPRRLTQAGRRAGTLFMFDEPTTGLHFDDIRKLLQAFDQLLDAGHSLLVIEHNLDVIAASDWVIDLGPEAGDAGGFLVACETPQELAARSDSHTGLALANYRRLNEPSVQRQPVLLEESAIRLQASDAIVVHRARENNLKQLDVQIPRNQMTVITGPSGSGKSSLAFDVIFGEGQRRYLESLNAYARQFVQPASKPDVEGLYGIPPTVAIEQRSSRGGQKSTVATLTEVYHFLRLLWMRLGTAHCPDCKIAVEPQSFDQLAARLMRDYKGRWIGLCAVLVSARKGSYKDLARWALDKGYSHFRVDGKMLPLSRFPALDRYQEHNIELPVASLRIDSACDEALRDALERCLELGKGNVLVLEDLQTVVRSDFYQLSPSDASDAFASRPSRLFSTRRACSQCGLSLPEPDPRLFSFNSKMGACPDCQGTGLHLSQAIRKKLDEHQQFGAQTEETLTRSEALIDHLEAGSACASCQGERLNPVARAVLLGERSLGEVSGLSVSAARAWFEALKLDERASSIAKDVLSEVHARLEFLERVGLGYLSLNRAAPTLSGGEAQRIRLAAQLGSNLQGVCYVLDEPTIGLHPRDNKILVDTLQRLRDRGNTLLVVEHDEETIRRADYLIDIGPGAGRLGGHLMASGKPDQVLQHPESLTARFLRQPLKHPTQPRRPVPA